MNGNVFRKEILAISIYKILEDSIRYTFGILLIIFNFSINNLTFNLFKKELAEDPNDAVFAWVTAHIRQSPMYLAKILVIALIAFSIIEIFFLIGLVLRRKWGAIGFFCMQFLWVPIDIMIISKFLLFSRVVTIILWAAIIFFMIRLLVSPKGYFKK